MDILNCDFGCKPQISAKPDCIIYKCRHKKVVIQNCACGHRAQIIIDESGFTFNCFQCGLSISESDIETGRIKWNKVISLKRKEAKPENDREKYKKFQTDLIKTRKSKEIHDSFHQNPNGIKKILNPKT